MAGERARMAAGLWDDVDLYTFSDRLGIGDSARLSGSV
ncbi:hypothetical protein ATPR_3483 [Acetobacter tropicalis NBRC 101654]|uniref:Uncharacterized protein n=1 Tax=Acetobacter tropicalis NBRC 101654 TaxID=749388 RepID=F7VJD4_9PROT|nr:hypothetical protein ATPR_3483 [Acetobacter tropicalis NBRC 101654]